MSNNTTIETNNTIVNLTCSPGQCNNYGACNLLNSGKSTEWYECICDLWHTGQRCEHQVPLPIAVTVTCTFFVCAILFFCWRSSYKFSKRKIHVPKHRRRFVDHLNRHQRLQKHWLRSKLDEDNQRTGRVRDIPFEEQTDQEPESKEKPKEEKKEEVEVMMKRPEPNKERELEKLKEEETVRQLKAAAAMAAGKKTERESTMMSAPEPSILDVSQRSTASTMSTSTGGFRELSAAPSTTTNAALPEDAPKDNKDFHNKRLKDMAQQEKWAEMASAELNKKKKKK